MVKLALRAHVGNEWRAEKLRGKKLSQRGSKHRRKVLPNVRESSREDGHGRGKKVSTNRCGVNEAVTHQVSLHPRHPRRCLHHRLGRPRHHWCSRSAPLQTSWRAGRRYLSMATAHGWNTAKEWINQQVRNTDATHFSWLRRLAASRRRHIMGFCFWARGKERRQDESGGTLEGVFAVLTLCSFQKENTLQRYSAVREEGGAKGRRALCAPETGTDGGWERADWWELQKIKSSSECAGEKGAEADQSSDEMEKNAGIHLYEWCLFMLIGQNTL